MTNGFLEGRNSKHFVTKNLLSLNVGCNGRDYGFVSLVLACWGGVVAVREEREAAVEGECDELEQLETGDITFPPEIFLHLRPERGHEVVEIHHHVYAHI